MPINPELTDDSQDEAGNSAQKNQISSGQSADVTPGSSSSSQAGGASKQGTPTSSGSFTNLNQYVNANKDQSAGLGSKIEQNVQGGANAALGQLSASGQEFNTKEQAAGVNPDDFSQQKVYDTAQKALSSPADIGQSDIDKFNEARTKSDQFATGTDTGPRALTELNSYQTAKNSLTNAAQNAGLVGTESGRDTLLKQTYAKPGYTQGQTNLDQLLTQNVASNKEKFKDLQNNLLGQYGLASQDAAAVQAAADQRQKVSAGTQQAGSNIKNVLLGTPDNANPQQGVLTQYQTQLQNKPADMNAAQEKSYNDKIAAVTAGIKNQFGSTAFGIPPEQLAQQIVNAQSTLGSATLGNSFNTQDIARLNALNSLAGRETNTLGDTKLGDQDSNLFNAAVNTNYAPANQAIQQKLNVIKADTASTANQGVQRSTPQMNYLTSMYRGHDKQGDNQGDRLEQVNQYNTEANGIAQNIASEIQKLNAQRSQNGLPDLNLTAQDVADARYQAMNRIAYNMTMGSMGGSANPANYHPNENYLSSRSYLGNTMSDYINDRLTSSDAPYASAYNSMLNAMTNANAYNSLLQKVNSNPSYQMPSFDSIKPV